jgi:hypothetical protein
VRGIRGSRGQGGPRDTKEDETMATTRALRRGSIEANPATAEELAEEVRRLRTALSEIARDVIEALNDDERTESLSPDGGWVRDELINIKDIVDTALMG